MVEEANTDTSSTKRPLTFVSEGAADLDSQKTSEEKAQERYTTEKLQHSRKSLRDQLRTNGTRQRKKFTNEVRNREKFNRLSKEELTFFNDEQKKEDIKEKEEKSYLDKKSEEFERKRLNQVRRNNLISATASVSPKPSEKGQLKPLEGSIIKKKTNKLKIKLRNKPQ